MDLDFAIDPGLAGRVRLGLVQIEDVTVKPQDAAGLLAEIGPKVPADKLVISLCAGLPISFFARRLAEGTPVVRVMTNTPALVDEAMTAISAGPYATAGHLALAEEMFTPLGRTIRVPESQQDAVTALSGSGPAYFYLLVEAMRKFHLYYGDEFKVECPARSGKMRTLHEVADELADRLAAPFLVGSGGVRPVLADDGKTPAGSVIVIEAETLEDAKAVFAQDPYTHAGLWDSASGRPFNWLIRQ